MTPSVGVAAYEHSSDSFDRVQPISTERGELYLVHHLRYPKMPVPAGQQILPTLLAKLPRNTGELGRDARAAGSVDGRIVVWAMGG